MDSKDYVVDGNSKFPCSVDIQRIGEPHTRTFVQSHDVVGLLSAGCSCVCDGIGQIHVCDRLNCKRKRPCVSDVGEVLPEKHVRRTTNATTTHPGGGVHGHLSHGVHQSVPFVPSSVLQRGQPHTSGTSSDHGNHCGEHSSVILDFGAGIVRHETFAELGGIEFVDDTISRAPAHRSFPSAVNVVGRRDRRKRVRLPPDMPLDDRPSQRPRVRPRNIRVGSQGVEVAAGNVSVTGDCQLSIDRRISQPADAHPCATDLPSSSNVFRQLNPSLGQSSAQPCCGNPMPEVGSATAESQPSVSARVSETMFVNVFDAGSASSIGQASCFMSNVPSSSSASGQPSSPPRRSFSQTQRAGVPDEYIKFGPCNCICSKCHALFWYEERLTTSTRRSGPLYHRCCMGGKVRLFLPRDYPAYVQQLFSDPHFLTNIRAYNQMFSMTSLGATIDESVNIGRGPYVFKVSGQIYHRIGHFCPLSGESPRFLQLYIYETDKEVANRLANFDNSGVNVLKPDIVQGLIGLLDRHNALVQLFRTARDKLLDADVPDFKIRLFSVVGSSQHELPTADEIGAIVFDSGPDSATDFDVVIQRYSGDPERINKLHPAYMSLHFPLLFIFGEQGYHTELKLIYVAGDSSESTKRMSMDAYYAYLLHDHILRTVRGGSHFYTSNDQAVPRTNDGGAAEQHNSDKKLCRQMAEKVMEGTAATPVGSTTSSGTQAMQRPDDKGKGILVEEEEVDLRKLKPQDLNKPLEIRVFKKWASRNVPDPNPTGLCFILLDKQGGAIQANVQVWDMKEFDSKLQVDTYYIGIVRDVGNIRESGDSMTNRISRRNIEIQNLNGNTIIFTLWNEQAIGFPINLCRQIEQPPIIAVTSCWAKRFGDEPEAPQPHMQIQALQAIKPETNALRPFVIQAVITKIDEAQGWYFNRCRTCHLKIAEGWPHPHCQQPGVRPTPNYTYSFKATLTDATGSIVITCFSPEADSLLLPVSELLTYTSDPDPYVLPDIIRDLENTEHIFTVHIAPGGRTGNTKYILDHAQDVPQPALPEFPTPVDQPQSPSITTQQLSHDPSPTRPTTEPKRQEAVTAVEIQTTEITPPPNSDEPSQKTEYHGEGPSESVRRQLFPEDVQETQEQITVATNIVTEGNLTVSVPTLQQEPTDPQAITPGQQTESPATTEGEPSRPSKKAKHE
ncbi:helitron helicase-like domain-containing protein [Artemisia annua]|uniref:Helitron helicase-like domain-containing protein n=1 Tax=Artemisia annua TaxID=35608 RepID=A0A2U1PAI1_ARTAN|nr:helitron helicase-like domain-containing protein [Artemisia annua]